MTGLILIAGAWAFADIALRVLNRLDERADRHLRAIQESARRREWPRKERE